MGFNKSEDSSANPIFFDIKANRKSALLYSLIN